MAIISGPHDSDSIGKDDLVLGSRLSDQSDANGVYTGVFWVGKVIDVNIGQVEIGVTHRLVCPVSVRGVLLYGDWEQNLGEQEGGNCADLVLKMGADPLALDPLVQQVGVLWLKRVLAKATSTP